MNVRNKEDKEKNKKIMEDIWKREYESKVDEADEETDELEQDRLIMLLKKTNLDFTDLTEEEKAKFMNDMKSNFYKEYLRPWVPWWNCTISEHIRQQNKKIIEIKREDEDEEEDDDYDEEEKERRIEEMINELNNYDEIYCISHPLSSIPLPNKISISNANSNIIFNILSLCSSYLYSIKMVNNNYSDDFNNYQNLINLLFTLSPSLIEKCKYNSFNEIFIEFNMKLKIVESDKRKSTMNYQIYKDILSIFQVQHFTLDVIYNIYCILNNYLQIPESKKDKSLKHQIKLSIKKIEYYFNYVKNIQDQTWLTLLYDLQQSIYELNKNI